MLSFHKNFVISIEKVAENSPEQKTVTARMKLIDCTNVLGVKIQKTAMQKGVVRSKSSSSLPSPFEQSLFSLNIQRAEVDDSGFKFFFFYQNIKSTSFDTTFLF